MAWLDTFIGWIAPERAYERHLWRQELARAQNYDAAEPGRGNWRVDTTTSELSLSIERDTVRARARDLERNTDLLVGVLSAFDRNVIGGDGFNLQAKTENPDLNTAIESAWGVWSRPGGCDVSGMMSFTDLCRLMLRRKKVDGGVLILLRYLDDSAGGVPLRLQMLEVDALDRSRVQPKLKKNRVVEGIEIEPTGKTAGYWIHEYDDYGNAIGSRFEPEQFVIFYHTKTRAGQVRELSDFAPVLNRIRDMHEYMSAINVKERVSACFSVFIRRQQPTTALGRGPSRHLGDSYTPKRLSPGMIAELEPGEDISVAAPAGQGAAASEYIGLQMHLIAAGMGLSYEAVSRDLSGVSYSSARQGQIEDLLVFTQERDAMILQVLDRVFRAWLQSAVTAGALTLPGYWQDPAKYEERTWAQAAKPWIDPLKEARARGEALRTGVLTFAQVCAERGYDWRDQLKEIAEIEKFAAAKGVNPEALWKTQLIAPAPTEPDAEPDSGKEE